MADKIRGITIEIGGDTSGLTKSLKDVNKETKNVSSQLKDVERLLKLDPTNTDLLRQKQTLLEKQIGNTNAKLEELNNLQEQMKENGIDETSDQYMALEREIISTERNLASLTAEAEQVDGALSGAGNAADDASGELENAGDSAEKSTSGFGAAEVAIGNLVSRGIEKLISACADAVTGMFSLSDEVNTLAKNYGITQEAAFALYQNQDLLDYSVSGVTRMMREQYKELSDGTDKYDELGIAVKNANGEMLSQEEVLFNTLAYLRSIDDPVQRAATGVDLLGVKYYDLGGILNSSEEDFNSFRDSVTAEDEELRNNLDGMNAFQDAIDGLKKSMKAIAITAGQFFGKLSKLKVTLPAVAAAVVALTAAWLSFGGAAKLAALEMSIVNAVMSANPIGLIVIAVAALVAAFILLWNNCEGFSKFFIKMWETIKNAAINTWNAVTSFAKTAVENLKTGWGNIVTFFTDLWDSVTKIFNDAVNLGKDIVENIKSGITGAWDNFKTWLKNKWESIKNIFTITPTYDDPNGGYDGSGATGISTVPFSGYTAMLHKNEAVLTANQAREWRNGSGTSTVVNLSVYPQDMSEAQIDYLVNRVNVVIGGAAI